MSMQYHTRQNIAIQNILETNSFYAGAVIGQIENPDDWTPKKIYCEIK